MLSVRPRINDLAFRLFSQEVHPELFEVCAYRMITREQYSIELNITTDGHVIRFRDAQRVLTEISAGVHRPMPGHGLLMQQSIDGCLTNGLVFEDSIDYQTSVQLEIVKPSLFVSVQQQLDQRMECQGLIHRFGSNGRLSFGAISYIHVQSFLEHALVRAFHTFPESSAVVTSETRFRLT